MQENREVTVKFKESDSRIFFIDNNIHMQYGIIKNNKYYFSNWDRTLIAISSGSTALKANEKALRSLNKLSCWNLVYRSDIGSKSESLFQ
jgi:phosphoribosylamine-glycine ligase